MTDEYRTWSAAYVLGALDAEERADFEAHLQECEGCRGEVAGLAPLPGLLARTSPPDDALTAGGALDLARTGVASERRDLRRSRRWWQAVALGSVAAVLVMVLFLALDRTSMREQPAGQRLELDVASATATAEIGLVARPWGSVVDIHVVEVSEPPEAEAFTAWVVDRSGRWEPACTWALDEDGWARVEGASSTQIDEVAEVVVTASDDRTDTLLRAAPPTS